MADCHQPRLRLRGTFIDTDDHQADLDLRPRAHSEPRSGVSKAESDTIFETEQMYVEKLDQNLRPDSTSGSSRRRGHSREGTPERFMESPYAKQDRPARAAASGQGSGKIVDRRDAGAELGNSVSTGVTEGDDFLDCYEVPQSTSSGYPGYHSISPGQCPYFSAGHCSNGENCNFSHILDDRRPHIDFDRAGQGQAQQVRPSSYVSGGTPDDDAFTDISCQAESMSEVSCTSVPFFNAASGRMAMPQQMGHVGSSMAPAQQLQIFTALQLGQTPPSPGSTADAQLQAQMQARGPMSYGQAPTQQQQQRGWHLPIPTRSSMSETGIAPGRTNLRPETLAAFVERSNEGSTDFTGQRQKYKAGGGYSAGQMANAPSASSHSRRDSQRQQGTCNMNASGREELRSSLSQKSELSDRRRNSAVSGCSSNGSKGSRASNIIPALEEIPRRIGRELQRVADYIMESMHSEVRAMINVIEMQHPNGTGSSRAAKVVEHLQGIPTMGKSFLEARMEKTKATVRFRIGSMMQELNEMQEKIRAAGGRNLPEKACSNCGIIFSPEAAFCLRCGTRRKTEVGPEEDKDAIVKQMQRISAEVEQLAGDAVQAAAKECIEHQTRQIDYALASLPRSDREALKNAGLPSSNPLRDKEDQATGQKQLAPRDGKVPESSKAPSGRNRGSNQVSSNPQSTASASSTAEPQVSRSDGTAPSSPQEQLSLPAVSETSPEPERPKTKITIQENKELNEMQERLRLGGMVQSTSSQQAKSRSAVSAPAGFANAIEGADVQFLPNGQRINPGSIGHPDVCLRPCLYFAAGRCSNGQDCTFCHLLHPKRPARLDKRHREMLKRMPFVELLHLCLPLLKQKAIDNGSLEVKAGLDQLAECASRHGGFENLEMTEVIEGGCAGSQVGDNKDGAASEVSRSEVSVSSTRRKCGLQGALQVMGARMILSMLSRMPAPEAQEEKQIVDEVLAALQDQLPEDKRSAADGELRDLDTMSDFSGVGSNIGSNVGSHFSGSPPANQRRSFR